MRKTLGILAAVLLALSIFSAVLGLGGIAAGATGSGSLSSGLDVAFTVAWVLFVLSLLSGVVAIFWPKDSRP
ncbi:DUF1328 domain-containing protein [Pseudomonas sp. PDM25]|jgi:uncharacterized membrane protein YtjA (UPF0391 family)|uniref:DUF1328 domain-containing protein n=1 Tax=Pseudomonas sp. PDM25 TaxID=2854772 RepID=UPI001C448A9B|nr:DUF1328 domain-containing protein [Pseudomonas sp. PDM25]MBV7511551.1 DUF1328 domain-containing protein [Pseudomonas sp. PDM25]